MHKQRRVKTHTWYAEKILKCAEIAVSATLEMGKWCYEHHERYTRNDSMKQLKEAVDKKFGSEFRELWWYYAQERAYLLSVQAGKEFFDRTKNLEAGHWIDMANRGKHLPLEHKLKILEKASKQNTPVRKLRDEIITINGRLRRARRAAECPAEAPLVRNCFAAELVNSLEKSSISFAPLDWQWSYPLGRWQTQRSLPLTYPQSELKDGKKALAKGIADLCELIQLLTPKMEDNGIIGIHAPSTYEGVGFDQIRDTLKRYRWIYDGHIVWHKCNSVFGMQKTVCNSTEMIYLYYKEQNKKKPLGSFDNLVESAIMRQPQHPFQKPVELCERAIEACCPAGRLVVDCYAGSGSYGVAAKCLARRYVGSETIKEYAEVANVRIAGEQGGSLEDAV